MSTGYVPRHDAPTGPPLWGSEPDKFFHDDEHVASVLALGGYPRATVKQGWLGPDGRAWRAAPKLRRVRR